MYKYKAVYIPTGEVFEKEIKKHESPHFLTDRESFLIKLNDWNRIACLTENNIPVWLYYTDET